MGFRKDYARDVDDLFQGSRPEPSPISEDDLSDLPGVIQEYLRFVGVVGEPRVWNYRVRFDGELRNDANSPWMKMSADQLSFFDPAARLFLIKASRLAASACCSLIAAWRASSSCCALNAAWRASSSCCAFNAA